MRTKLHQISLAVFAALAFGMASQAQSSGRVHLKSGIIPVPEDSKVIIAHDKGFFAQEGLDVELVEFANSADGMSALRARKIDVGAVGVTAPLVHISKGAENIRIIGGIGGEGSAIVVRADKLGRIRNLKGLKGLKVGTVRLSSSDAIVRAELARNGINWAKDLHIFELKSPAAVLEAVKSGGVDAGVVWEPFDVKAEEAGLKILVRTGKLSPGHPCCRIAVLSEDLTARPGVWKAYLKAILKAERYIQEHREDAITTVTKALKIESKLVESVISGGHTEFTSDPNVRGVVLFWDSMKQSAFINSGLDIRRYIDTLPYKSALESLRAAQPRDTYWKSKTAQFKARN